jgi:hypothetical protein
MKKTTIALALMVATDFANAALTNGSTLNIGEGSYFTLGGGTTVQAPGFDGQFITGHQGLVLGTIQTPSGSHYGEVNGSENPGVDNPWVFFFRTGMSGSEGTATNVLSASGNTATVDFSGWMFAWGGFESSLGLSVENFGSGAWFGATEDGVAQVTCGLDCGDGDTYTLIYSAAGQHCPPHNGSFCGTHYLLNLTGTISAVPVPAAVWLFGSGLIGLAGVASRHKVS